MYLRFYFPCTSIVSINNPSQTVSWHSKKKEKREKALNGVRFHMSDGNLGEWSSFPHSDSFPEILAILNISSLLPINKMGETVLNLCFTVMH